MIKLIVYDLDGTIIDSAPIVLLLINQFRSLLNKDNLIMKEVLPFLSIGGEKMIKSSLDINDLEIPSFLEKFRNDYFKMPTPQDSLYPGIRNVLENLSQNYSLAICTNKPRKLVEKILIETELADFFTFISAGDDLITKKPHPHNLKICMDHFSVTAQDLFLVGDSTVDLALALSCNVKFIHFIPGYNDGININQCYSQMSHHNEIFNLLQML